MPELPDVAVYKNYVDRRALGKRIEATRVFDDTVIKDIAARTLQRRLVNHSFESSRRRGKHLFLSLDSEAGWLGLHFGMTGNVSYFEAYEETPEYTRIRISFASGSHLAYICKRNLGRVRIINDLDEFIAEQGLGPDALDIDRNAFVERIGGRRGRIKSALMNQSVIAGIGNVYADEVLFHARVHPETDVTALRERQLRKLFEALERVMEQAVNADARPEEMPSHFLLPHRSEGETCPRCGGKISKMKLGGRPSFFCSECQQDS